MTKLSHERRCSILCAIRACNIQYFADAGNSRFDSRDFWTYIRKSSNGKGWVIIAPGEPANNYYIDDPVLFKFFNKKYLNQ